MQKDISHRLIAIGLDLLAIPFPIVWLVVKVQSERADFKRDVKQDPIRQSDSAIENSRTIRSRDGPAAMFRLGQGVT